MITNESASQSQLSTDLEMLHARVKGKSLTLDELKQLLNGRGSAMLLILLRFSHWLDEAKSPSIRIATAVWCLPLVSGTILTAFTN
jgi:hypothetical protein